MSRDANTACGRKHSAGVCSFRLDRHPLHHDLTSILTFFHRNGLLLFYDCIFLQSLLSFSTYSVLNSLLFLLQSILEETCEVRITSAMRTMQSSECVPAPATQTVERHSHSSRRLLHGEDLRSASPCPRLSCTLPSHRIRGVQRPSKSKLTFLLYPP